MLGINYSFGILSNLKNNISTKIINTKESVSNKLKESIKIVVNFVEECKEKDELTFNVSIKPYKNVVYRVNNIIINVIGRFNNKKEQYYLIVTELKKLIFYPIIKKPITEPTNKIGYSNKPIIADELDKLKAS